MWPCMRPSGSPVATTVWHDTRLLCSCLNVKEFYHDFRTPEPIGVVDPVVDGPAGDIRLPDGGARGTDGGTGGAAQTGRLCAGRRRLGTESFRQVPVWHR